MPLTPLEIHNKEFGTRMRGYDQDEVNEFLDQIIRDYELVIRQNKENADELEIINKKLSNYEEMQDSLNRSILVAQDAADRLKENTDREIEVVKREAQSYVENVRKEADDYATDVQKKADDYTVDTYKKADEYFAETQKDADEYSENIHKETDDNADALLKEAVAKARKIEDETEALRKQSRVFRQRLQLLIESQLELLTKEDWDNLLVGRPIEYPNIETIQEVEKELEEKVDEPVNTEFVEQSEEDSTQEMIGKETNGLEQDVEEDAEAEVLVETSDNDENSNDATVAFEADEHYNSESQDSDDYEEGSMPAIELPDSAQK